MLTSKEKEIIRRCAEKYRVSSVYLFGSSLKRSDGRDIDLGIKGIEPVVFFKFYSELFKYFPRPVDLIDLSSENNYLSQKVIREGEVIYEA